ncbi:LOW QUALITY PROTEIN: solute carrier family 53 member 1-like [Rhinophrynus dorsalis]
MRFAEHLSAHLTPEWRKQYICYKALKDLLYQACDKSPVQEGNEVSVLQRHLTAFHERFFQMCDKEVTKVNTFYAEKVAEAERRFASLAAELDVVLKAQEKNEFSPIYKRKRSLNRSYSHRAQHKTLCDLKLAYSELYLSLVFLQNYQNLNYLGFNKITEKYDKLFGTQRERSGRCSSLFTSRLEGGDRQKAMKRLRVPPLGADQPAPAWTAFSVGLLCGLLVAFTLLISITVFQSSTAVTLWPLLRLYRGGFLIIEFIFLLGINNYGWWKAGVNHILIFELDPTDNLSHLDLFELSGFLGVTWCVSVLSCLYAKLLPVSLQFNPLVFYSFLVLILLNPTTFYYKSRVWLLQLIYRMATAPFHVVGFADFWLADQLNSLTPMFVDSWGLCCFYIFTVDWRRPNALSLDSPDIQCTGSTTGVSIFIQCIPPWIRFAQCLRRYWDSGLTFLHLINAGKYSTVFIILAFATFVANEKELASGSAGVTFYFYAWIITVCLGTLFATTWDLRLDWGLLERNGQENKFLRDEMVYYYWVIAGDVLLRVSWAANIFYAQDRNSEMAMLMTCVLGPLEVFRRFIWNFFRLENEHLSNCGQFRAVRDISIAPLHSESQTALEHLMDQEDGVKSHTREKNSRKKKKQVLSEKSQVADGNGGCVEAAVQDKVDQAATGGS